MLFLYSFRFGYQVIGNERGKVCIAQMVREELWQENPVLTTTASQCGGGKLVGCVQRRRNNRAGLQDRQYIFGKLCAG